MCAKVDVEQLVNESDGGFPKFSLSVGVSVANPNLNPNPV